MWGGVDSSSTALVLWILVDLFEPGLPFQPWLYARNIHTFLDL